MTPLHIKSEMGEDETLEIQSSLTFLISRVKMLDSKYAKLRL